MRRRLKRSWKMTTWRSKIPQTVNRVHKELSELVRTSALRVEAGAKLRAPVDTGFLRRSIQTQMEGDLSAVVFVAAEYGIYVELGTTRMRARPYLLPALEEVARSIGGEVKQIIR